MGPRVRRTGDEEIHLLSSDAGDSDGDVEVVENPETEGIAHGQRFEQRQQPLDAIGKHFRSSNGRSANAFPTKAARTLNSVIDSTKGKRKSLGSSPDELAPKVQDMRGKLRTRPPGSPSPSMSKRGNIPTTDFTGPSTELNLARDIIGGGLRVLRAASGSYKYESGKADNPDECFLRVGKISTILLPADVAGREMTGYEYCSVNYIKVNKILYSTSPTCRIVHIERSSSPMTSSAPKLVYEFQNRNDLDNFIKWAKSHKRSGTSRPKFDETDQKMLERILDHMLSQATRNTTIRDNQADDVRQVEHNRAVEAKPTTQSQVPTSHIKKKDLMKPLTSMSPSSPKTMVLPDETRRHNPLRQARTTRSSFALIGSPESPKCSEAPEPDGWSVQNKDWEKEWRNSLVFPPHGKSRATVDKEDISRLDEGEFLNDNLLTFYLRYLQHSLEAERPDLAQKIYFHNTYFYEKLKSTKTSGGINYDSVKAWTSKVDLFTKDFIIVPINEYTHWYVAIIYNAPKLLPSPGQKEVPESQSADTITVEEDMVDSGKVSRASSQSRKPDEPRGAEAMISAADSDVINHLSPTDQESQKAELQLVTGEQDVEEILDRSDSRVDLEQVHPSSSNHRGKRAGKKPSIGPRKFNPDHPRIITLDSLAIHHSPACRSLKQYLVAELKDKKGIEIPIPGALGMTARAVPEQNNHCDCGLFLLGYIKEFLDNPYKFVHSILQHEPIDWNLDPSELRNTIRNLIFKLQKEQQDRDDARKQEKRQAASLKKRKHPESEQQATSRSVSVTPTEGAVIKESDNEATPRKKSPTPNSSRSKPKPVSASAEDWVIPGSYPVSPAVVRVETRSSPVAVGAQTRGSPVAVDTDKAEQNEIQSFLPPLSETPLSVTASGSSEIRPVVVDEVSQAQNLEPVQNHSSPKQTSSRTVVRMSPQHLQGYIELYAEPRVRPQSNETPTTSPYFAGRQDGDTMPSARLREQLEPSPVIDISD